MKILTNCRDESDSIATRYYRNTHFHQPLFLKQCLYHRQSIPKTVIMSTSTVAVPCGRLLPLDDIGDAKRNVGLGVASGEGTGVAVGEAGLDVSILVGALLFVVTFQ